MRRRSTARRARSARRCCIALLVGLSAALPIRPAVAGLDPTFSTDGRVTLDDQVSALGADRDGLLVATISGTDAVVHRFDAQGRPVRAFSGDGQVRVDFAPGVRSVPRAVLRTARGVVLAGRASSDGIEARLGFVRLRDDGTYDPTFSGDGRLLADTGGADHVPTVDAIRSGADGSLTVSVLVTDRFGAVLAARLLRLDPQGRPDPTFGPRGWREISPHLAGSRFDRRGGLVSVQERSAGTWWLVRSRPDGSADTAFSDDGRQWFPCPTPPRALPQPSGYLLTVCTVEPGTVEVRAWNAVGGANGFFSGDGRTSVTLRASGVDLQLTGMAVDPDGALWLTAHAGDRHLMVVVVDVDGRLDRSFSGDGRLTTSVPRTPARLAIDPVAGSARLVAPRYSARVGGYTTVLVGVARG